MKDYQDRDKLFYVSPQLFPEWPYPSRYAIGMKFSDFTKIGSSYFRFKVNMGHMVEKMFEIPRGRALNLGEKYKLKFGALPNLIPLDEFKEVSL